MSKNIVIVESPGKIKSIQRYLDESYKVVSTYGHVRDLPKQEFGIDIPGGFKPTYIVNKDKKEVLKTLSAQVAKASFVYLASDDDREGEAIAWHTKEALKLPREKYQRIVFRSITKSAIENALANPRGLDESLVDAQQARRILDRIVGYKISPVLWKKVMGKLSAGRVQSILLKLITEREHEIHGFVAVQQFKITGLFLLGDGDNLKASLPTVFSTEAEAHAFLTACQSALFTIGEIKQKTAKKSPPPPLMTSTLQQIASQELGYTVSRTMSLAQQLYEQGYVTYIRTDSLNLAKEALGAAKEVITKTYGAKFVQTRQYKTKSATAQEAHEAIRPTRFEVSKISEDGPLQRLYTLIRNRALASQMAEAVLERTTAHIHISTLPDHLVAKGELVTFPGFLAVYHHPDRKEQGTLPPLAEGQAIELDFLQANESYTKPPSRYTEGTLVKKLENLGIGRPSTYRHMIATVQQRDYVVKKSPPGKMVEYICLKLQNKQITRALVEELVGSGKNKFFPTSIGMVVEGFLGHYFEKIMDYAFTANVEVALDKVAHKGLSFQKMLSDFYGTFLTQLEKATAVDMEVPNRFRTLGEDPATKKPVIAYLSRQYGPLVRIGSFEDEEKPRVASLREGQLLPYITLPEALALFELPRNLGDFESHPITVHVGRFGGYLKHGDTSFSLRDRFDPYTITQEEAIPLIEEKRKSQIPIKTFEGDKTIEVRNGRYGPYIKTADKNVPIPKGKTPADLTLEECKALAQAYKKGKRRRKKK